MTRVLLLFCAVLFFSWVAIGQAPGTAAAKKITPLDVSDPRRSSPAYAEVLLRRTEIEAELESLLVEYTEDYPKVKQERFELDAIGKESDRLLAVKASDIAKLTSALGKLTVRKVELQGELWSLQQQLGDSHPDVKRAKRKVEIFERAIKEILG
ncbi:MAG: hypothetical protein ABI878_03765 [Acidobacteriota bacterium]